MSEAYWQAKIWGLLHDPGLKALSHSQDLGREGQWAILRCMQGWQSPKDKSAVDSLNRRWLDYVGLCDLIASASDRSTIGRLAPQYSAISYQENGLQIHHLLSGKAQKLQICQWHERLQQGKRKEFLEQKELEVLNSIKDWDNPSQVHWWLWRCYPDLLAKDTPEIYLLPAETRLPDASLWSHTSITSALAGGLAGYYRQQENYPAKNQSFTRSSRPHLVVFTFSPVQELVKASRKMRDFWAGSWLLHYLSAKVCWELAKKYGADTFLYPCLYQQPLIDHWLLKEYPHFGQWIEEPTPQQLLTAGFPNVIVMILPNNGKQGDEIKDNPIYAATQYAKQVLEKEWQELGTKSLEFLQKMNPAWKEINPHTWDDWLKSQWQTYWTALPIGNLETELHHSPRKNEAGEYEKWCDSQNDFTNLKENLALFETNEAKFLKAVFGLLDKETETDSKGYSRQPNLNVGSWWGSIFDRLRDNLTAVKNARTWSMPTAFGPRSTISGIGSVVHPIYDETKPDWATEGQTKKFWSEQKNTGLFDGIEELNATEVVKRVLHKILPDILGINDLSLTYPDLSSGVAGWLKQAEIAGNREAIKYYQTACGEIYQQFSWTQDAARTAWGIPWIKNNYPKLPNPRLLNAGWLIEDFKNIDEKQTELSKIKNIIANYFPPGKNPTDWYVLAAGDGDSMREWLKGAKLKPYQEYIPQELQEKIDGFPDEIKQPVSEFLKVKKRMGPATHSALSRSLLDFANQLVPYLTESRYAGRLIYCGGDDILSYTNLWEWDSWLWDIRQCFKGQEDPQGEFESEGDYWKYKNNYELGTMNDKKNNDELGIMNDEQKDLSLIIHPSSLNQNSSFSTHPSSLTNRPLFTLGSSATISFGIVIAHHSVPLAIALENLWEAEEEAKEHYYIVNNEKFSKDAVQVRTIYGNGNILKSTAKFKVFASWRELVDFAQTHSELDSAIFEQAAEIWSAHPAPKVAIAQWTKAFCERRAIFSEESKSQKQLFIDYLSNFLTILVEHSLDNKQADTEIKNWLKLAAFTLRNRQIN
ncbi:CRISPR-associated protein [Pleurocapsa sp. PCC 7327]|uniref:type III-B CRISPR-associated protein Cas10/Cmr2 n=1 Tax=Pleurocapsa sp. PCC 7327 TaxID=118163 RepID=UPI00029FADDE|nr:type III-B CRISPR-associated protein Cas10/Cmr2 [Pleurocapsa sp. PCC 7327]AFY77563.1 CRISPR-associated protein [Pleurocapsa sp. PCC 7327]